MRVLLACAVVASAFAVEQGEPRPIIVAPFNPH
jgi:hypothetical protein